MRLNPEYTEPDSGQYDRQAAQYARNNPVAGVRHSLRGSSKARRNPEPVTAQGGRYPVSLQAASGDTAGRTPGQTVCLQSSPTWNVRVFLERLQEMPRDTAIQYLKETYPGIPGYVRDKLLRCEYRTQGKDVYVGL